MPDKRNPLLKQAHRLMQKAQMERKFLERQKVTPEYEARLREMNRPAPPPGPLAGIIGPIDDLLENRLYEEKGRLEEEEGAEFELNPEAVDETGDPFGVAWEVKRQPDFPPQDPPQQPSNDPPIVSRAALQNLKKEFGGGPKEQIGREGEREREMQEESLKMRLEGEEAKRLDKMSAIERLNTPEKGMTWIDKIEQGFKVHDRDKNAAFWDEHKRLEEEKILEHRIKKPWKKKGYKDSDRPTDGMEDSPYRNERYWKDEFRYGPGGEGV
jgi:hypothetical protein